MSIFEKVKELSQLGEVTAGDKKEKKLVNRIKAQFENAFDEIRLYYYRVLNWSLKEAEIECEGKKIPNEYFTVLPYSPSADIEGRNYQIIPLNNLQELNIKYARLNEDIVPIFTLNDESLRKIVLKSRELLQNKPQNPPSIPAFFVNKDALSYLKGECRFYVNSKFTNSTGISIEGIINGKTDEKIYVTAHHDHWFNGEHDNLVGVSILSELKGDYDYEIHAISFTAEESGCYFESFSWACGSKQFVKTRKLDNTKLVISIDNISGDTINMFYTPFFAMPKFNGIEEVPYPSPYTDSYRFLDANIPTISFHSLRYKYYHSNLDILSKEESAKIEQTFLPILKQLLKNPPILNLNPEFIKNDILGLPSEIKAILVNGKISNILTLYKSILYPNGKIVTSLFHTLKGIKDAYYSEYLAIEDFGEIEYREDEAYYHYLNELYRREIERYVILLENFF